MQDPSIPHGGISPLVLTKTRVPSHRIDFVRRTHLIDRVSEAHDRSVTLVNAPAGYGKSTLLLQWAEADPNRRFAWVTLENTENDPITLWRYILFALRSVIPGLSDTAWRLLSRPDPDLTPVINEVINGLIDVPGRLVLVLDDFHMITNPECHTSVQYLVDHMPPSFQVALGTRQRPPLTLSALEADGLVLEIRRSDLRFTLEETVRAIALTSHELPAEQSATVHEDMDGWPVGVYLSTRGRVAASRPGISSSSSADALYRYLEEQILDELTIGDRHVLTQWSILRRLTGDLCDHITGESNGTETLVRMAETNQLVIPLDEERHWYRFHDLLQDTLLREFQKQPSKDRSAAHLRAMEWWLLHGEIQEAIVHAIDAADFDRAGELICMNWFDFFTSGRRETLLQWLHRFPDRAFEAYPPLLITAGWIAAFGGDVDTTRRYAAEARRASFDRPMPDGTASYESALAILSAALGHTGMLDANTHAEIAYDLEPPESPFRDLACALAGVTRFGLGEFDRARIALTEAASLPTSAATIYAAGELALLELHTGNVNEARRHANTACALIDKLQVGHVLSSGAAQAAFAMIAAHDGKQALALQQLRGLSSVMASLSDAIPFDAFQIHLVAAETYLELGADDAAAVHAEVASSRLSSFGDAGVFEPRMAAVLAEMEDRSAAVESAARPTGLTERELQVIALLATDLSLREIGDELFVSRNTAKTHLTNAYRKLGVTNRTAAVTRARELELL